MSVELKARQVQSVSLSVYVMYSTLLNLRCVISDDDDEIINYYSHSKFKVSKIKSQRILAINFNFQVLLGIFGRKLKLTTKSKQEIPLDPIPSFIPLLLLFQQISISLFFLHHLLLHPLLLLLPLFLWTNIVYE